MDQQTFINGGSDSPVQDYKKLLKTIERQNEYIHSLNSILSVYETALYVDLRDFTFKVLAGTAEVKALAAKFENILEIVKVFGEYQVKPEHKQFFYTFLDPMTVSERLAGQRYLTAEYDTLNIGWVNARLIPVEYDYQGNLISLIFTTECIEATHKELEILRHSSETDALTGLHNRQKGQRLSEELLATSQPLVFVLLDCDRFKHINDTLSHLVGDKVLIAVAATLKETFPNQTIFRLGGDEFIVIMSGDAAQQVIAQSNNIIVSSDASGYPIFSQLRENMNKIHIPELEGSPLTVSGGAVIYRGGGSSFNELYRKSDRALQASKFQRTGVVTIVNL